jgi:hypothetical protein
MLDAKTGGSYESQVPAEGPSTEFTDATNIKDQRSGVELGRRGAV